MNIILTNGQQMLQNKNNSKIWLMIFLMNKDKIVKL